MKQEQIDKLIEEKIQKALNQISGEKPNKKFTITWCAGTANGEEILYDYHCDYWLEHMLAGGSIIFAGDLSDNTSLTVPFTQFRAAHQNYDVKEDIEKYSKMSEEAKRRNEIIKKQVSKENADPRDVA